MLGSVRLKPGDSGSSMYTSDGYLVGVLTSNQGQYSWNCSAWHIPAEMGLNILGGETLSPSPSPYTGTKKKDIKSLS